MNDPTPDDDLEALFARQRTADREQSPAFHAMRTRALQSQPNPRASTSLLWRWGWPVSFACALAIAFLALHHHSSPPATSPELVVREIEQIDADLQKSLAAQEALTAWQSPTDFLLNLNHHPNP